ncbi:dTMP kinase [Aliarcobacter butzleri]
MNSKNIKKNNQDEVINRTGFYLVLEGVDFSGKTSLAKELVKKLEEIYGKEIVFHRKEPGNVGYGSKMRDILFNDNLDDDKEVLAAKYMLIDRINNTSEVAQLLRENKIVIQERNFLTALVYNEATYKDEVKFIQEINKLSLKPDLLALVNISDTILDYRIKNAEKERGKLDSYETYEKVSKRKKEYLKFPEYIDVILQNDNKDSFETNISMLVKLTEKYYTRSEIK